MKQQYHIFTMVCIHFFVMYCICKFILTEIVWLLIFFHLCQTPVCQHHFTLHELALKSVPLALTNSKIIVHTDPLYPRKGL